MPSTLSSALLPVASVSGLIRSNVCTKKLPPRSIVRHDALYIMRANVLYNHILCQVSEGLRKWAYNKLVYRKEENQSRVARNGGGEKGRGKISLGTRVVGDGALTTVVMPHE